jgi:hypothetical protein
VVPVLYERFHCVSAWKQHARIDLKEWGASRMDMFHSALAHLRDAGFSGGQIGVYLLGGLPGSPRIG